MLGVEEIGLPERRNQPSCPRGQPQSLGTLLADASLAEILSGNHVVGTLRNLVKPLEARPPPAFHERVKLMRRRVEDQGRHGQKLVAVSRAGRESVPSPLDQPRSTV